MGKTARINAKLKSIGAIHVSNDNNSLNYSALTSDINNFMTNEGCRHVMAYGGMGATQLTNTSGVGTSVTNVGITGMQIYEGSNKKATFSMNTKLGISYVVGKSIVERSIKEWVIIVKAKDGSEAAIFLVSYNKPNDEQTITIVKASFNNACNAMTNNVVMNRIGNRFNGQNMVLVRRASEGGFDIGIMNEVKA